MSRETLFNAALAVLLLAVPLAADQMGEPFFVTLATRVAILALAATGLNLALGYGGLVSFGHAAFFGIGGYAAGILSAHALSGEPLAFGLAGSDRMAVIWLVAASAAGAAGAAIGAISLRTSGVHFIMITLAFAQMVYYFAVSWPAYGGEDGLSIPVRNGLAGLDTFDPLTFFLIAYALLLAGLGLVQLVTASRFGNALQAARQNEARVVALGIEPRRIRLVAFALSAMITGVAGALHADLNRFVSPAMMSWHLSGELIVLVILGGTGRLFGPVAGAMLFVVLEYALGGATEHWQAFLGLILLAVVLHARGGLVAAVAGAPRHG